MSSAHCGDPMSALGHKQTFAVQQAMSALPPMADIIRSLNTAENIYVSFVFA